MTGFFLNSKLKLQMPRKLVLALIFSFGFFSLMGCTQINNGSSIDSSFLASSSLSVSKSLVSVSATSVNIGSSVTVTTTTYDQNGSVYVSPTPLTILFSNTGGTSTGTFSAVTDHHNGTYTATFTGTAVGTATTIQSSIDGVALTGTLPTVQVTLSLVGPTVTNVTSSTANGSYKAAQAISIQVTFSAPVLITGTPQLTLGTAPNEVINYTSGSGTATLTFTYTVQPGDTSAHLEYTSTAALTLNGGTIKDYSTNNATLTLPGLGGAGSLSANKTIIIDTTAPAMPTSLVLTTPASSPGTVATPVITVSGGVVSGDIVTLFTDGVCSAPVSSATTSAGASVQVTTNALANGNYTFYAQSSDAAGNLSACSVASVSYTYSLSPIGAYTITGITGPGDAVLDSNLNNGLVATVNWNAASSASDYDVTIYASNGTTVVCALANTAATSHTFTGCTLTAGSTYKAKVTANRAGLTSRDASNSLYTFLVNQNPTAANFGPSYVAQGASISFNVVASATDPDVPAQTLTVGTVSVPTGGTTTSTATTITYTAGNAYTGTDSFTYTISDGYGGSATGTISLKVMSAYTWTGQSGVDVNWSTSGNWCGTVKANHSGCNGGSAPGNNAIAVFDGTCVSNCSATVDGNIDIGGLKMGTGYTGTITQGANTFTVEGSGWTQAAGVFTGSAQTITVNGSVALSGGTLTSTSGTFNVGANWTISGAPTFNHHSGTMNFSGGGTITNGSLTYSTVQFSSGDYTMTGTMNTTTLNLADPNAFYGGTIDVSGDVSSTAMYSPVSTLSVVLNGTGAQTVSGNGSGFIPSLTIASSGAVTLSGTVVVGNFTYTSASSLTTVGAELDICEGGAGATVSPGNVTYASVAMLNCSGDITLASTMNVQNLTFSSNHSLNGGGTINVSGNFTGTTQLYSPGSNVSVVLNGAGAQTVTGGNAFIPSLTIASTGAVTLSGVIEIGSLTYTSAASLTVAGSTLDFIGGGAGATINPGAVTYGTVEFSASDYTLNGTMNVGDLTLQTPNSVSDGTINVAGNFSTTNIYGPGSNTLIVLNGTGAQSISGTASIPGSTLTINKASGTATLANNINMNNGSQTLSIQSGAMDMAGFNLSISSALTLNGTTLTKNGGTLTVNGNPVGSGALDGGTINP